MTPLGRKYRGVWPVLVTPFNQRGGVDLGCYRALVDWYIENGVAGLFASCLSSEMFDLDEAERLALVRATVEQAKSRVPVAATGSLGSNMQDHVRLSQAQADLGVDAVILTPPAFSQSETDLEAYFLGMAEEVDADLGLYECPYPVKRLLSSELVARLAKTGRFGPFKETSCNLPDIEAKVRAAEGTPLSIMQANCALMVEAGRLGAGGFIGLITNVAPRLAVTVWERVHQPEEVAPLHDLLCLLEPLILRDHPAATKALLALQGFPILPRCRRGAKRAFTTADRLVLEGGWRAFERILAEGETVPGVK